MKAHELAKQLLAGPDVEVWAQNEAGPILRLTEIIVCDDNSILLELREDDGSFV